MNDERKSTGDYDVTVRVIADVHWKKPPANFTEQMHRQQASIRVAALGRDLDEAAKALLLSNLPTAMTEFDLQRLYEPCRTWKRCKEARYDAAREIERLRNRLEVCEESLRAFDLRSESIYWSQSSSVERSNG